jgi:hypothetical protein
MVQYLVGYKKGERAMLLKKTLLLLLVMVLLGMIAACGAQPAPQTIVETVVVTKEVEVPGEKVVETVEVVKESC